MIRDLKISHEKSLVTTGPHTGQYYQVTRCSYKDLLGNPMAASFMGWLFEQTVKDMIKANRQVDNQHAR